MGDEPPAEADDDGWAVVDGATRRADHAWWWVGLVALILVLHVATGGWPGMTVAWTVLLLLRIRDAVRARRAEQAALRTWSPPSPWRRDRRRRGR